MSLEVLASVFSRILRLSAFETSLNTLNTLILRKAESVPTYEVILRNSKSDARTKKPSNRLNLSWQ